MCAEILLRLLAYINYFMQTPSVTFISKDSNLSHVSSLKTFSVWVSFPYLVLNDSWNEKVNGFNCLCRVFQNGVYVGYHHITVLKYIAWIIFAGRSKVYIYFSHHNVWPQIEVCLLSLAQRGNNAHQFSYNVVFWDKLWWIKQFKLEQNTHA